MNQVIIVNCIVVFVFIIFLIGILKNFLYFFISKNKVYLAFAFFLLLFAAIFVNKRLFKILFDVAPSFTESLDFLLLTLVSGATVYLAQYFLSLVTLTKISIAYFIFEVAFSVATFTLYMLNFDLPMLRYICFFLVAVYAFYLLLVIVNNLFRNSVFFSRKKKLHYAIFILLHSSNIVLCFSLLNPQWNLLPIFLYIEIILIIFYLDFFILLRPTAFYQATTGNSGKSSGSVQLPFPEEEEGKMIQLILNGKSYKEISFEMNIPFNTVKKKISYIYKKYNVKNKNQLMALFYKE